ncbi:MAG: hypothetical protein GY794_13340 [bacterium]|nr:hypothetical protein [bacterium]
MKPILSLTILAVMLALLSGCRDSSEATSRKKLTEQFGRLMTRMNDGHVGAGADAEGKGLPEYATMCQSIDSNVEQGKVLLMGKLQSGSDAERSLALTILIGLSSGGELWRARNFDEADFDYFNTVVLELAKSKSPCSETATWFLLCGCVSPTGFPEFEAFLISLVDTNIDSASRGKAYEKLAYSQTEASWKILIQGLNEKEFMAYLGCLKALVVRRDARAVGPLIAELSKPSRQERFQGELGDSNTGTTSRPNGDMATIAKMRSCFRSESRVYSIERCLADVLGDKAPANCRQADFDWVAWHRKTRSRQ